MTRSFLHEELYRGAEHVAKLGEVQLAICGAGAVGSHLAENLVRQGFRKLRVIDRDRVEQHNVGTQVFGISDVGGWKVEVLRNRLFRAAEVEIDAVPKELSDRNTRSLLKDVDLIVETFDNAASRELVQQHCRAMQIPCLHVGLYENYCEVIWDQQYRVPRDVGGDVCEYPLARNLVLLAVVIAAETIVRYVLSSVMESRCATLNDFAVRELEQPVEP